MSNKHAQMSGLHICTADKRAEVQYSQTRMTCCPSRERKGIYSRSERPRWKAVWKSGCHRGGSASVLFKNEDNDAHSDTLPWEAFSVCTHEKVRGNSRVKRMTKMLSGEVQSLATVSPPSGRPLISALTQTVVPGAAFWLSFSAITPISTASDV